MPQLPNCGAVARESAEEVAGGSEAKSGAVPLIRARAAALDNKVFDIKRFS
jgi:hypothetical protein